jgi:hypothetical protein
MKGCRTGRKIEEQVLKYRLNPLQENRIGIAGVPLGNN